jgi:hypothetical protein
MFHPTTPPASWDLLPSGRGDWLPDNTYPSADAARQLPTAQPTADRRRRGFRERGVDRGGGGV